MTELTQPIIAVTRPSLPGARFKELGTLGKIKSWSEDAPPSVPQLVDLAGEAQLLLCVNGDPIVDDVLSGCPSLKVIALASAGYDSVDVAAARRRGIAVTNTPGILNETVADLTFALILNARRGIFSAERYLRNGQWTSNSLWLLLGEEVHSSTLGIVGYGGIGRAVARRAHGFGMQVYHTSRNQTADASSTWLPMSDLLSVSDIVTLHVPLTSETRGLIGPDELRQMKPSATLINTSRGAIVDEPALIDALRERRIASAGLDVQTIEPNPDASHPLLALDNCVVLPHIGGATYAARGAMVDLAIANLAAFVASQPLLTPL